MAFEVEYAFSLTGTATNSGAEPATPDQFFVAWGLEVDGASLAITAVTPHSPAAVISLPCRISRVGQTVVRTYDEATAAVRTLERDRNVLELCVMSPVPQRHGVTLAAVEDRHAQERREQPRQPYSPATAPYLYPPHGGGGGAVGGDTAVSGATLTTQVAPTYSVPVDVSALSPAEMQARMVALAPPKASAWRCAVIATLILVGIGDVLLAVGLFAPSAELSAFLGFMLVVAAGCVLLARTVCCKETCCCDATDVEEAEHAPRKQSWRIVANVLCFLILLWLCLGILATIVVLAVVGIDFSGGGDVAAGATEAPPTPAPPAHSRASTAAFALNLVGLLLISAVCLAVFVGRIGLRMCNCVWPDVPVPPSALHQPQAVIGTVVGGEYEGPEQQQHPYG